MIEFVGGGVRLLYILRELFIPTVPMGILLSALRRLYITYHRRWEENKIIISVVRSRKSLHY